jgi:hypothetical protein
MREFSSAFSGPKFLEQDDDLLQRRPFQWDKRAYYQKGCIEAAVSRIAVGPIPLLGPMHNNFDHTGGGGVRNWSGAHRPTGPEIAPSGAGCSRAQGTREAELSSRPA